MTTRRCPPLAEADELNGVSGLQGVSWEWRTGDGRRACIGGNKQRSLSGACAVRQSRQCDDDWSSLVLVLFEEEVVSESHLAPPFFLAETFVCVAWAPACSRWARYPAHQTESSFIFVQGVCVAAWTVREKTLRRALHRCPDLDKGC